MVTPGVCTLCKYVKAIRLDLYKPAGLGAICDASLAVFHCAFSTQGLGSYARFTFCFFVFSRELALLQI